MSCLRQHKRKKLTSFQVIILSFLGMILVGALLLMLPFSSRERCVTSFSDSLFTAVSATCVTGLVVKDTATYWSLRAISHDLRTPLTSISGNASTLITGGSTLEEGCKTADMPTYIPSRCG